MHVNEHVSVAAVVAAQGQLLAVDHRRLSPSGMERYWASSKCRLDRWARSLKAFTEHPRSSAIREDALRSMEETLTAEILTRVWTAVTVAAEQNTPAKELAPMARSILVAHVEARNRVLGLLVQSPYVTAKDAMHLNGLRRRVERWNDLLLAHLLIRHDVGQFAFDRQRAAEFAADVEQERRDSGSDLPWRLTVASAKAAFAPASDPGPNADLHAAIVGSILACFDSELFDAIGQFRSLWVERLTNTTNDAQGLVAELMLAEQLPYSVPVAATRGKLPR